MSNDKELAELVRRIIARDSAADEDLVRRYEKGVAIIIDRIVQNESVTEDLSQDTFKIVLQNVRRGDLRDRERLSGFICSVARNVAIDFVRKARKKLIQEEIGQAEHVPDPAPSQLDAILREERARAVRNVIDELKIERDREILRRYYVLEEDKDQICAALELTRTQFNNVLSRAKARFKELYVQLVGGHEQ